MGRDSKQSVANSEGVNTKDAMTSRSSAMGYFYLTFSMALVGAYVALSKQLLPSFPPFALAWIRFIIASVFMFSWLKEWKGRWQFVSRHDRIVLFGMSFFGNFLFTMFMLFGVANTSVAAAGIIMSLLPATVAMLSVFILRERLSWQILISLVLAIVGVSALSIFKSSTGQSWVGNVLMIGALLCEGLYVIGGKYLSAGYTPKQVAVSMNTTGLILTTPLGLYQSLHMDFASISWQMWALITFYAVAASQITTWLWFRGIKSVPASRAGVVTVALPLSASLIGVFLFHETWSIWHTFAFTCALAGVALVTQTKHT